MNHLLISKLIEYAPTFISIIKSIFFSMKFYQFMKMLMNVFMLYSHKRTFFPHSWLITGFVTRLTRRVSPVDQELLTLRRIWVHSRFLFSGVRVTRSLVLWVCFIDRCLSFCTFLGHCVVCSSSIYRFWLPLWYLWLPLWYLWLPLWYLWLPLWYLWLPLWYLWLSLWYLWLPIWYLWLPLWYLWLPPFGILDYHFGIFDYPFGIFDYPFGIFDYPSLVSLITCLWYLWLPLWYLQTLLCCSSLIK